MIARGTRGPSGITLTEILIAILIMGVGLISLATLFPLGLIRLREATRYSRAGLEYETASDDMDIEALFYKPSFTHTWYWTTNPATGTGIVPRDPFVQDVDNNYGNTASINGIISSNPNSPNGVYQAPSTVAGQPMLVNGLPFCYDPLWRSITSVEPNSGLYDPNIVFPPNPLPNPNPYIVNEARFGAGVFNNNNAPYIRSDPDGSTPSAYGLQRLTNFIPWSAGYGYPLATLYPFRTNYPGGIGPPDMTGNIFTSIDDIVFNPTGGSGSAPSSVLPDMSLGVPQADYRFTWFVTGRQVDAGGNGAQFVGEVVVCDGRPFGFDLLPGQTVSAPAGETVVEAIFGYGNNFPVNSGAAAFSTSTKTVLLRWPGNLPDPQVKVGGWICDVTYERHTNTFSNRMSVTQTTFARCYWYQIGKRTDPQADTLAAAASPVPYRSMVLTLTSPVRASTLLNTTTGLPVHLNAALVMPSVINVYPRAFEVH